MCDHKATLNSIPTRKRVALGPMFRTCYKVSVSFSNFSMLECPCCESTESVYQGDYICIWCRFYKDFYGNGQAAAAI